ncbi:MAG: phage holin family protein [Oscillospiraceae bacterium]|nr:phage holin family protein [Oscillospiraceae bacterium]
MNNPIESLPFLDKLNALFGVVVAVLSYILGEHWFLFAAFLLLNIIDYITGILKSKINNKENSAKGAIGALKKLGYWLMILVAFGAGALFIEIGEVIGLNLGISTLIGWFVLSTLIINELRSIIENFIEAGYNVPDILTKGLEVAENVLKKNNNPNNNTDAKNDKKKNE